MKELSNFILGSAYILSFLAWYTIVTDKNHFGLYLLNNYIIYCFLYMIVGMFIFGSIIWITIYFLTLINNAIRNSIKYDEQKESK